MRYPVMAFFSALFVVFGFLADTPAQIAKGIYQIVLCADVLITDYIAVGGMGAAFVNAGLLMLATVLILYLLKVRMNGVSVAAIFLMGSFALFGKNLFNIWIIIAGVYLYARLHGEPFRNYVHIAFFATSMSPVVTEFFFVMELPLPIRVPLGVLVGLSIGYFVPPLSRHMIKVHKGFNLYNIGFTVGILGTVYVSLFKSYGYTAQSRLVWSSGNNGVLLAFLILFFVLMIAAGLIAEPGYKKLLRIFSSPGRLPTDFIEQEGFGPSLVNMGLNGFVATLHVLLADGPLNGPTIGGILTVAGFGGFGKHVKNIVPILIGVWIGSATKIWAINDPPVLLAALFGTSLAPISGHYGWLWGILAGFINSSVALNSGVLHAGMNLYNTGFSAGIVATVVVPLMDALIKKKTVVPAAREEEA